MTLQEAEALVQEVFAKLGAIQSGIEMRDFALFCAEHEIASFIELGTCVGGMFYLLDHACKPGLRISMDMPWGQRDPKDKDGAEATFRKLFPSAVEIWGNIHDEAQHQRLAGFLNGQKVDLLWIDADHSYEGCRRHVEMYGDFVRPGGFVAFHDIANGHGCQKFYEETCEFHRHWEFVDSAHPFGIGVIQPL
jgi:hypothetical protein